MTNGEVFEKMYPEVEILYSCSDSLLKDQYWMKVVIHGFWIYLPLDWWNSPYEPQERNNKNDIR